MVIGKPKKEGRYKAEFSMGELDYQRFHKMMIYLDECAIRVRNLDSMGILPYYSIMKELYINFRPVIFVTKRQWFDKAFNMVEKEIFEWRERADRYNNMDFPFKISKFLERVHIELVEIKQLIGMGIAVQKEITELKKWERALRISED